MTIEQVVLWIIIGGIAGFLAEAVVKGIRGGLISAVVVGILGALFGGWLVKQFGLHVGTGFISDVIVAFVGAVILLLIMRLLRRL